MAEPFIGYPNAPKPKKGPIKTYEDTWLDSFLKGVFGEETPSGSVLEEGREAKVRAGNIGQAAGIASDFSSFIKPVALAGAGLAGLMSLPFKETAKRVGGKQTGAIRVGGAKDLYASHATRPENVPDIVRSGYLDAPSIGISSREANDYSRSNPQFIFRAGSIDPEKQFGTLVNRDGYFSNPRSSPWPGAQGDAEFLKGEVASALKAAQRETPGVTDLRLGQMWPNASQGLSIATSPAYLSMKDFEKSAFGADLLRIPKSKREPYWVSLSLDLKDEANRLGLDSTTYAKMLAEKHLKGQPMKNYEAQLVARAARSPSAMAEFKMLEQLPLNPADQAIYVPSLGINLDNLIPLRDAGFQMFTKGNLLDEAGNMSWAPETAAKRLANVPTPQGTFNIPDPQKLVSWMKGDARERWLDFLNPGAGGSAPLSMSSRNAAAATPPINPMVPPKVKPWGADDLIATLEAKIKKPGAIEELPELMAPGLGGGKPVTDNFSTALKKATMQPHMLGTVGAQNLLEAAKIKSFAAADTFSDMLLKQGKLTPPQAFDLKAHAAEMFQKKPPAKPPMPDLLNVPGMTPIKPATPASFEEKWLAPHKSWDEASWKVLQDLESNKITDEQYLKLIDLIDQKWPVP